MLLLSHSSLETGKQSLIIIVIIVIIHFKSDPIRSDLI